MRAKDQKAQHSRVGHGLRTAGIGELLIGDFRNCSSQEGRHVLTFFLSAWRFVFSAPRTRLARIWGVMLQIASQGFAKRLRRVNVDSIPCPSHQHEHRIMFSLLIFMRLKLRVMPILLLCVLSTYGNNRSGKSILHQCMYVTLGDLCHYKQLEQCHR